MIYIQNSLVGMEVKLIYWQTKDENTVECAGNAGENYVKQVKVSKDETVPPCKDIASSNGN